MNSKWSFSMWCILSVWGGNVLSKLLSLSSRPLSGPKPATIKDGELPCGCHAGREPRPHGEATNRDPINSPNRAQPWSHHSPVVQHRAKKLPDDPSIQLSHHPQPSCLCSWSTKNHGPQPPALCPSKFLTHRICEHSLPSYVTEFWGGLLQSENSWSNHHHHHSWTGRSEVWIFWNPRWLCETRRVFKNTIQAQCSLICCELQYSLAHPTLRFTQSHMKRPNSSGWGGPTEPRQLHGLRHWGGVARWHLGRCQDEESVSLCIYSHRCLFSVSIVT